MLVETPTGKGVVAFQYSHEPKTVMFTDLMSPNSTILNRKILLGEPPYAALDEQNATQVWSTNKARDVNVLPDYIRSTVASFVSGAEKLTWVAEITPSWVALTVTNKPGTTVQIKTP